MFRVAYWKNPDDMYDAGCEYINRCIQKKKPVTITGLCLHLGFASRQSFYDQKKRPGFDVVIDRLHLMVQHSYELRLHLPNINPVPSIYMLKVLGMHDRPDDSKDSDEGSLADSIQRGRNAVIDVVPKMLTEK